MPTFCRILSLASATALLCVLTSAASANRLSSTSRTLRASWRTLEFIPPAGETVRCPVTLEGSLHSSTITKVAGALIGYITRASVASASCSGSHWTVLTGTLPWHIRYRGFAGTLPNITKLETTLIGFAILVEGTFGVECLYLSTTTEPLNINYARNTTTHALASAEVTGEINSTTGCGIFGEHVRGKFAGTSATLTQLGSTAGISVTLI